MYDRVPPSRRGAAGEGSARLHDSGRRREGAAPTFDGAADGAESAARGDLGVMSTTILAGLQASAGNRATAGLVVQRSESVRRQPSAQHALTIQRVISTEQAESIARKIEDAMSGVGTDEEAIYGALAGRTGKDIAAIRDAYNRVFKGRDIDADLADELTESELDHVKQLLPTVSEVANEDTLTAAERATQATGRARAVAQQISDAIEGLGTEEAQIFNTLTGRTKAELNEIAAQYKALTGRDVILDLRGDLSRGELRRALNLFEVAAAGTFENQVTQKMVEGKTTGGRGLFNYTLHTDRLDIDVPIKFTPDENVSPPFALWDQQINDTWNKFALTEPSGMKLPINLKMRNDSGASREVVVHKNTDPNNWRKDRANAGEFYLVMAADTVPHEFGHFLGLEDEYQRYHPDFKRLVGETPIGPPNESGQTVEEIAADLHGALFLDVKNDRTDATMGVLRNVGLFVGDKNIPQQGTFAQGVMQAYDKANSGTLVEHMRDQLSSVNDDADPDRKYKKYLIQSVFSFASRTIMGNPGVLGGSEPHDHAVEARHMRSFVEIAQKAWPDFTWTVGPR
jgi:hypothetical protein